MESRFERFAKGLWERLKRLYTLCGTYVLRQARWQDSGLVKDSPDRSTPIEILKTNAHVRFGSWWFRSRFHVPDISVLVVFKSRVGLCSPWGESLLVCSRKGGIVSCRVVHGITPSHAVADCWLSSNRAALCKRSCFSFRPPRARPGLPSLQSTTCSWAAVAPRASTGGGGARYMAVLAVGSRWMVPSCVYPERPPERRRARRRQNRRPRAMAPPPLRAWDQEYSADECESESEHALPVELAAEEAASSMAEATSDRQIIMRFCVEADMVLGDGILFEVRASSDRRGCSVVVKHTHSHSLTHRSLPPPAAGYK